MMKYTLGILSGAIFCILSVAVLTIPDKVCTHYDLHNHCTHYKVKNSTICLEYVEKNDAMHCVKEGLTKE